MVIPDIKQYILNPIPSKPTLLESAVALVAIGHHPKLFYVTS
jgi:hypothetical protein